MCKLPNQKSPLTLQYNFNYNGEFCFAHMCLIHLNKEELKIYIYKWVQWSLYPSDPISFSIQLARTLITLSHIQQHSEKLFIHPIRTRMSGRPLPISKTLRISDDGIQRKLNVQLFAKQSLIKKLNLWDWPLCLLGDWVKKNHILRTKQNKISIAFMNINEKKKKRKEYTCWCAIHKT